MAYTKFASEAQSRRLYYLAFKRDHAVRPWMPKEVNKLLAEWVCVDFNGKPSSLHIPIFRGGIAVYDELCKIVSGPIPDSCLEPEIPLEIGYQLKLNSQLNKLI